MTAETITRLRAELADLTGPARLTSLARLAQEFAQQYWRVGPGRPEGLPDLDGAIAAWEECLEHLQPGDNLRGQFAAQLGPLLSARYSLHTEDERDREAGLRVLAEALDSAHLARVHREMCRVQLGQLSLSQVLKLFRTPGAAMQLVTGGVPADVKADVDRAVSCFRQVLAEGPSSDDVRRGAEPMLAVAEIMQTMVSGTGGAGIDLQAMMGAMAKMQELQGRLGELRGAGQGRRGTDSFFSFADMRSVMETAPLDRPVAVVEEAGPAEPPAAPKPPAAPQPADVEQLRSSLSEKLGRKDPARPVWAHAAELLRPDGPEPAIDVVDDLVALATMVVEADGTAVDRFVLAVALHLRDRLDDDGDRADAEAGAESLLAAVRALPAGDPAATAMLLSLGAFLDRQRPFGGPLEHIAGGFADRVDAEIAAGVADASELAALHALRCLCRAAEAVAEFQRAAVPPDYPWRTALQAAAQAAG
ncbi:hypothetical protein [Amycolatopsis sp. lyj-23]|uniref:hypothetical protein n=1 Tax=Amycolatopsis sp. lyj-23 TaxID=2789283 RepID=UPI003979BABD